MKGVRTRDTNEGKKVQEQQEKSVCINTERFTRCGRMVESDLSCIAVVLVAQSFEEIQVQPRLWRSHLGFILVATGRSCRGTKNFGDN